MAFIYNLTDTWNDAATTWNGIKLAVTNTASSASSNLLNLTVTGATTASFVVDKSGNLALNGTVNKITMTTPATGATLTLADGSSFITSGAYSSTFTFTGATTLTFPTSGTVTALGNTTTGSGSIVLASSPTLVTPNLGTPSAATLTNATGLPVGGISATGTPSASTYLRGDGSWASISAIGTVTSVAQTFTGGLISVSGSPITSSGTLALTVSGTSGGVPYFSSSSTWDSTGVLTSGALLIGGGAGAGPSATTTGTGVVTALGVNVGSAGAFVVNGGALGTPSSGTLTNATGLPISTGVSGLGTGVASALATNVGSVGAPVVDGGALGTPSSGTLTNATGLPISTGVSGLGTGVASALATNVGSAGSPVINGGALGTPSSGTLTNATGLPISTGVSGLGTGIATFLATPTSANLASAVTDETGSGSLVFSTNPVFTNSVTLGTQSTTRGTLVLANTTAGSKAVTLQSSNSTAAAYTLTFPAAAPVNGYYLQTDVNGVLSWAAGGGGGGGSPGGSDTQVQFNDASTFGGAAAFTYNKTTYTLGLGVASTTTGKFTLANAGSSYLTTIKSGAATASVEYTLPLADGGSTDVLSTDGAGGLGWRNIPDPVAMALVFGS